MKRSSSNAYLTMTDTDAHRRASGPYGTHSGAEDDLASLYHAHHAAQFRRAGVMARTAGEAADAVNEAFVDTYRRWSTLSNPSGYLSRAVVSNCRDGGRRASTRDRLRLRLAREPRPVVHEDPVTCSTVQTARSVPGSNAA